MLNRRENEVIRILSVVISYFVVCVLLVFDVVLELYGSSMLAFIFVIIFLFSPPEAEVRLGFAITDEAMS